MKTRERREKTPADSVDEFVGEMTPNPSTTLTLKFWETRVSPSFINCVISNKCFDNVDETEKR